MSPRGVKRKLAAVVHADVKGYSALMGVDEEGTVRMLAAYRDVLIRLIELYGGRLVDTAGDGFLCEFASAVNAVEFAVEFQQEIDVRNSELPEDKRMAFRLGINVGDVIEEDGQIYGDGVNIAARLEGVAEAGGICISGTVYDQIRNKMDLGYQSLGEQSVKNIAHPVRAFKVKMGSKGQEAEKQPATRVKRKPKPGWLVPLVVTVIVGVGAVGVWLHVRNPDREAVKSISDKSKAPESKPAATPEDASESTPAAPAGAPPGAQASSEEVREAALLMGRMTKEANAEARQILERILERHPNSVRVHRMLGATHFKDSRMGWTESPEDSLRKAREFRRKADNLMDQGEGKAMAGPGGLGNPQPDNRK
ncbi:MAG: adenylate/guanylate cyclase domain-containing protein [Pseudomonadota bacterium]